VQIGNNVYSAQTLFSTGGGTYALVTPEIDAALLLAWVRAMASFEACRVPG